MRTENDPTRGYVVKEEGSIILYYYQTANPVEIDATGGGDQSAPCLSVEDSRTEESYLIEFPDYKGYEIFSALAEKSGISITFVKK
jgi:hypothetical protein